MLCLHLSRRGDLSAELRDISVYIIKLYWDSSQNQPHLGPSFGRCMAPNTQYHSIVNYPPFTEEEMEVLGGCISQWFTVTCGQVRWSPPCPSLKPRYLPTPTWSSDMHSAERSTFAILDPFYKILLDMASPSHEPLGRWSDGWFALFATYVPVSHPPFFWMGRGSPLSS